MSDDAMVRAMRLVPLLREVPVSSQSGIRANARLHCFAHNEAVFEEVGKSDRFSFVTRGWIKLSKVHATGRSVIICLVEEERLLCGNAVYAGAPYCCSAIAASKDVEVLSVSRYDLLQLVERHAGVMHMFLSELSCRGMQLCGRVEEITSGKVERRLASLFVRLLPEDAAGGAALIPLRLSRQELADLCGTTVETAIRAMRRFERQGVLQTTKQGFLVADSEVLRELVELRP